MARRSGLGRGLSSLIPRRPTRTGGGRRRGRPDRDRRRPGRPQPATSPGCTSTRSRWPTSPTRSPRSACSSRCWSRRVDDGYQLIAGERRWRARARAGLTDDPGDRARLRRRRPPSRRRWSRTSIAQDLTALEEAAAYLQLIEDFQLTHDDVAKRVGKSRSAVTNTLRLMGLPPEVQRLLADGKLSAGHARALLGTADRALQEQLAGKVVGEGWSVRAVEDAVRRGGAEPSGRRRPTGRREHRGRPTAPAWPLATRLRPPGLLELEELLADHLDTRVSVQMGAKRGRVMVEFADLEDLERIYRRIVGG